MEHHYDPLPAKLLGVNIAALTLATIITSLRCYVRIWLIRAFGVDDWLMMGAMVTFTLYCTFSISGVVYGTGRHVADVSQEDYATAKKWWWGCYLTYALAMICAKLSIAWFLLRVAVRPAHRWIIHAAVSLTVVSCICFFFACLFQCWPVSYFWDKYTQTGKCIPDAVVIALAFVYSAISIITDFVFALLPAWIISHLNMKLKTKMALVGLMGMGCVASAAVVVRLPYLHFIASDEFLYDTSPVAIWSTVEQGLAISAGGLATLQPLVKLIGYKLGLASYPAIPASSRYANRYAGGAISVRRSISRRTEAFEQVPEQHDQVDLKLQPGTSGYSATCYNTSQEELRLGTAGSEGKRSKDSDAGLVRGERSR